MTDDLNRVTCAEFQEKLSDLIGSGQDARNNPHLQNCELCRALLADLETIAEAARQLFPNVEPPDEVWEHIETAIKGDNEPEPRVAPRAAPQPH